MTGFEPFVWVLLALGWAVFEVLRRVLKPPRRLGTIDEEPEVPPPLPSREMPPDVEWGRQEVVRRADEPFAWSADHAQAELGTARALAARQAVQRQARQGAQRPRRHPRRPSLRNPGDLRDAIVLTAILGPCRAEQPYDGPGSRPQP